MEGIQISVYYVGVQEDIALIQIGGYLDTVTSSHLGKALEDVTTEGYCNVICDLGNINYISSAGWGIFVSKIRMIRDMGGDLVLSQMIPDVFDVFKLLEFDRILKFYDNSDKAIKEFDEMRGLAPVALEVGEGLDNRRGSLNSLDGKDPSGPLAREISAREDYSRSLPSPTIGDRGASFEHMTGGGVEVGSSSNWTNRKISAFPYMSGERNVLDRDLPLNEKIKLAVIDNPLAGATAVRRVLNSSRFGYVRVGYLKIRKTFKELDLDTKEKRYRFWRSR